MECLLKPSRVAIDAGHGGRDPGASVAGVTEAELVLAYARALRDELKQRGHATMMTRPGAGDLAPESTWPRPGKGVDLMERSARANTFDADAFISLHANAASSRYVRGAWVIYAAPSKRGAALATAVFGRLRKVPGAEDADPLPEVYPDGSGWTGGRTLSVLRKTRMPAILVELGFLTHKGDRDRLRKPDTVRDASLAIADGLEDWLRAELKAGRA